MINKADVDRTYYRGSGKGGQNRNKVETGVRLVHLPTGIKVEFCVERTRGANEKLAWSELQRRLDEQERQARERAKKASHDAKPKASFASQIRTYVLDGKSPRVVDHRTGVSSTNPRAVLDGKIDDFVGRNNG